MKEKRRKYKKNWKMKDRKQKGRSKECKKMVGSKIQ